MLSQADLTPRGLGTGSSFLPPTAVLRGAGPWDQVCPGSFSTIPCSRSTLLKLAKKRAPLRVILQRKPSLNETMCLAMNLLCILALTPLFLGVAVIDQSKEHTLCVPHGTPVHLG